MLFQRSNYKLTSGDYWDMDEILWLHPYSRPWRKIPIELGAAIDGSLILSPEYYA